jgi:hypothetical protein
MVINLDQTGPLIANAGLQQNVSTFTTVNSTTNSVSAPAPSVATAGSFTTSSSLTPLNFGTAATSTPPSSRSPLFWVVLFFLAWWIL